MANGLTAANTAPTGIWKKLQQLIAGIQKDIPTGTNLMVNGKSYGQAQLIVLLQGLLELFVTANTAKIAYVTELKTRDGQEPTVRATYAAVKGSIVGMLGHQNPLLGDFGIAPHVPKVLTTEQKQLRAAKAQLTREKRHTMGRLQKAALKVVGTPTVLVGPGGVVVTPSVIDQAAAPAGGTSGSGGSAPATPAAATAGGSSSGSGK